MITATFVAITAAPASAGGNCSFDVGGGNNYAYVQTPGPAAGSKCSQVQARRYNYYAGTPQYFYGPVSSTYSKANASGTCIRNSGNVNDGNGWTGWVYNVVCY